MDNELLQRTFLEGKAELEKIKREFDRLAERKADLESLVADISRLLGRSAGDLPSTRQILATAVSPSSSDTTPKIWMLARDVLAQASRRMSVPELHEAINREGILVSNPDALRVAMRRHPEVFDNERGRFCLKSRLPQGPGREGEIEGASEEAPFAETGH